MVLRCSLCSLGFWAGQYIYNVAGPSGLHEIRRNAESRTGRAFQSDTSKIVVVFCSPLCHNGYREEDSQIGRPNSGGGRESKIDGW